MSDLRDKIRAQVLATHKPKSKQVEFFGEIIEIRQPTLEEIMQVQTSEDRSAAVTSTLIRNAYVPGTDEKVFEDTDVDQLMKLPFGADLSRVASALKELAEVDFFDGKDTSSPTPPESLH